MKSGIANRLDPDEPLEIFESIDDSWTFFGVQEEACILKEHEWMSSLTLLHSDRPILYTIMAVLSAIGLRSSNSNEIGL